MFFCIVVSVVFFFFFFFQAEDGIRDGRVTGVQTCALPISDIAPFSLKVGGIVVATPDSAGNKIYYSLDTARQLANRQDAVNYIQVNWRSEERRVGKECRSRWWPSD